MLAELNNLAEMNYNELEKIKGHLKEYIKQVQDIVNENTRLKKQLEYVRGENDKLVKDVNNLNTIIDSWEESYNILRDLYDKLKEENTSNIEKAELYKADYKELETTKQEFEDFKAERTILETQYDDLIADHSDLVNDYDKLTDEYNELQDELNHYKELYENNLNELNNTKETNKILQKDNNELNDANIKLHNELNHYKELYYYKRVINLDEFNKLKQENESLKERVNSTIISNKMLIKDNNELNDASIKLHKQNEILQNELNHYKKTL